MNMLVSIPSVQYLLLAGLGEEVLRGALQPPGSSSHFFISSFFLGKKSTNQIHIPMVCPFTHPSVPMLLLSLLRFNLADVNQILPGDRGFQLIKFLHVFGKLPTAWGRHAAPQQWRSTWHSGPARSGRPQRRRSSMTSGRDRGFTIEWAVEVGG